MSMTCVQTTPRYSHLLSSCVTMLLSACAYIITHTVTSGGSEVKRGERQEAQEQRDKTSGESGTLESARQEQRDEESVVTEETRQREQSLSSEPQPNRTDPAAAVEKEVEVHVQHQQQEEEAPESRGNNEAAVLRNGDVTPSTVAESEPTKVRYKIQPLYWRR